MRTELNLKNGVANLDHNIFREFIKETMATNEKYCYNELFRFVEIGFKLSMHAEFKFNGYKTDFDTMHKALGSTCMKLATPISSETLINFDTFEGEETTHPLIKYHNCDKDRIDIKDMLWFESIVTHSIEHDDYSVFDVCNFWMDNVTKVVIDLDLSNEKPMGEFVNYIFHRSDEQYDNAYRELTDQDIINMVQNYAPNHDLMEYKTFLSIDSELHGDYMIDLIDGYQVSSKQALRYIEHHMQCLTLSEYNRKCSRTLADLGDAMANHRHMTDGLITEVGEIIDAYKRHTAYGAELDMVNISEEHGDLFFYQLNHLKMLNEEPYKVLYKNNRKLEIRYRNGFTTTDALKRNLEQERKTLEK